MSQENSVSENKGVEKPKNGEENGIEKSSPSPPPESCGEHRNENAYSGSLRSNKKIFVGALTPETTEQDLFEYFSKFGEIASCAVKVYRETGSSRGFGFIVFKNDEAVRKVLSISEHIVNGKKIDPKPAKCPKDTQRKVFVGGLDPDVTPKEIEEHFSKFGKVEAVETPYDNARMRRRSYVFVVFSSEFEARRAASIERQEINGKSCDVRVAVPRDASFRQRAMAQVVPQFTLADIQQAMLNFFYYNSLSQQPALQNHFAWPQAAHHATNRSPFRAAYDQQTAEKLFNQPAISRAEAPWYDSSMTRPPPQTSVSTAPQARNPPQPPSTHPYLTFPFSYHSAAAAAAAAATTPQHFYYHATPGYYYQPAPTSVSPPEAQNPAPGANGNVNQAANQTNAMNDFMATIVTANQMPFITAPAASAYPAAPAADMGYMYRQQQQQPSINPAFYQGAPTEGIFNDPAAGVSRSHFYGGTVPPPTSSTGPVVAASPSSIKPRGPKSHLNGMHQATGAQNGHVVKQDEGVNVGTTEHSTATTTNGASGIAPPLETQMANLSVAEI